MCKSIKTVAIVVTFNRLNLLKECIFALRKQTYTNLDIIVVNNGSTDGTSEYLSQEKDLIVINQENSGGAGGFYTGLKIAYDKGYDAFVLMDDDGIPMHNEIEELMKHTDKYDYINALVVSKDDESLLVFETKGVMRSREKFESLAIDDIVKNHVFPFNGSLFTRKLVSKVGFPIPELFIYGDEYNYTKRAIMAGFTPVTAIKAIHKHPVNYLPKIQGKFCMINYTTRIESSPIKIYCSTRNYIYNYRTLKLGFRDNLRLCRNLLLWSLEYYKKSEKSFHIFKEALIHGWNKNLSNHNKYL